QARYAFYRSGVQARYAYPSLRDDKTLGIILGASLPPLKRFSVMHPIEKFLRLCALPISVCIATGAMYWVYITYPYDEDFMLERLLPLYSLFLVLTAASMGAVSGQVRQFLIITALISALFVGEMFLRVVFGIFLF
ncbi:MAG: hypothetical protein ACLFR0_09300, partial [Alphaproteobacteria bacterium]